MTSTADWNGNSRAIRDGWPGFLPSSAPTTCVTLRKPLQFLEPYSLSETRDRNSHFSDPF